MWVPDPPWVLSKHLILMTARSAVGSFLQFQLGTSKAEPSSSYFKASAVACTKLYTDTSSVFVVWENLTGDFLALWDTYCIMVPAESDDFPVIFKAAAHSCLRDRLHGKAQHVLAEWHMLCLRERQPFGQQLF